VETLCAWLDPADEVVVWFREETLASALFTAWIVALVRRTGRTTRLSVAVASGWAGTSPETPDQRRTVDSESLFRLWVCLTEEEPDAWAEMASVDGASEVRRVVRALINRLPDATVGLSVLDAYLLRLLSAAGDWRELVLAGPAEVEMYLGADLSGGQLDSFDDVGGAARARFEWIAAHPDPLVDIAPPSGGSRSLWTERLSITPRGRAVAEGRASAWGTVPREDFIVGHHQRPGAYWVVDSGGAVVPGESLGVTGDVR
jgi:hypothetical protein